MAKMRGIKPETFTDSKILRLSPLARWLFIGLWTEACDNGHVLADEIELKVRLLPVDNADVGELLSELEGVGVIRREPGVITVCNLGKHQKIDRRYFKTCGVPSCEKPETGESTPNTQRDHGEPTRAPDVRTPSPHDEGEGEGEGETLMSAAANAAAEFDTWWEHYPAKRSKPKALEAFKKARKKVSLEELTNAVIQYGKWLTATGTKPKYAQGWLNDERWTEDFTVENQGQQAWDPWSEGL